MGPHLMCAREGRRAYVCAESLWKRGQALEENRTSSGAQAYGWMTQADLVRHGEARQDSL